MGRIVLVCRMWNARRKARRVAETEVYHLLRDLDPEVLPGGPLSGQKGVFWVGIPAENLKVATERFPRLGYTQTIDVLVAASKGGAVGRPKGGSGSEWVRWRKRMYRLERVYEGSAEVMRETAPDRRAFRLRTADGQVRAVRGYRGDGGALSRRGLPPHDARLLVNLVRPEAPDGLLLDPFAGVGGIVWEARSGGYQVLSADIDPFLKEGLAGFGSAHVVADAAWLPFATESVAAIATEPPYDRDAGEMVRGALAEMVRVLQVGGRVAVLCAAWQAEDLREMGEALGLVCFLDERVDRKGTDCWVLGWLVERSSF